MRSRVEAGIGYVRLLKWPPSDNIDLKRDRDLEGRRNEIWVRRGLLALVLLVTLAAVFNAFGQRPQTSTAAEEAATLKLYSSARMRVGDIFQARFTIRCSP